MMLYACTDPISIRPDGVPDRGALELLCCRLGVPDLDGGWNTDPLIDPPAVWPVCWEPG